MSAPAASTASGSDVSYELTYFNGRGLAETARLLFVIAGVPFKDNRLTGSASDEWVALKPSTMFGKLPLLTISQPKEKDVSVKIPQSRAIERLLAKRFGLYGNNDVEAALIDAVVDQISDIRTGFFNAKTDADKAKFFEQELPVHMLNMEKVAAWSGTGEQNRHIVGSSTSWADVALFSFFNGAELSATFTPPAPADGSAAPANPYAALMKFVEETRKHENLMYIINKIANNHKVAEYVAARKPTPF